MIKRSGVSAARLNEALVTWWRWGAVWVQKANSTTHHRQNGRRGR